MHTYEYLVTFWSAGTSREGDDERENGGGEEEDDKTNEYE